MPTQVKVDRVEELKDKLERCSIAVSTNYTGIGVNDITDLRRRMRDAGVEFTVVKNNLMKLACDASQHTHIWYTQVKQSPADAPSPPKPRLRGSTSARVDRRAQGSMPRSESERVIQIGVAESLVPEELDAPHRRHPRRPR